jgi:hypothetical protein
VYYLPAKNRKYPKPDMHEKELKKLQKSEPADMGGMNM